MTEEDKSLKEAIRRLETLDEHIRYGDLPSDDHDDLASHSSDDDTRFAEITQRLDDLESMIMNVMQKTGMFKKPGGPTHAG
jgi:hypothetical protein